MNISSRVWVLLNLTIKMKTQCDCHNEAQNKRCEAMTAKKCDLCDRNYCGRHISKHQKTIHSTSIPLRVEVEARPDGEAEMIDEDMSGELNVSDSKSPLDQFYTKPEIASRCLNVLLKAVSFDQFDVILEPSAGKGSFSNLLPTAKRLAIDIDPKADDIIKQDFFTFTFDKTAKYLVIGNPPFGRVSSLAVRFFNKAAEFAQVIAFIVPRTFNKLSVQNKLDMNFHLTHNEVLPLEPCCFEPAMSAKCCFQIWERKPVQRSLITLSKEHSDFTFVNLEGCDFIMRRCGGSCGQIFDKTSEKASTGLQSWYWIKANIDPTELRRRFALLDFSICEETVGQKSLGKQELVHIYATQYDDA